MHKYRLLLAYDGTDFCGWQQQPQSNSVQQAIATALNKILAGEAVQLLAAGRTDKGVHAEGQVAVFSSTRVLDSTKVQRSLNAMLAPTICVRACEAVPENFHPIYDAQAKIYRYRIRNTTHHDPFTHLYEWHIPRPLNLDAMRRAATPLLGKHDFTSFCAADSNARNKVRTLHELRIEQDGVMIELWFTGNGFLKQMVRTITGTLVTIGLGRKLNCADILQCRDRQAAAATAPARGLTLIRVVYNCSLFTDKKELALYGKLP